MIFSDAPEDQAFRQEIRGYLKATQTPYQGHHPGPDLPAWIAAGRAWQRDLWGAGFVARSWPEAYGGRGGTYAQDAIVAEELLADGRHLLINGIALQTAGPAILEWGSDEQKDRYIPAMLEARELWCQMFSEPSAGSDLAALRMRATHDGEGWHLTGQKVWTSGAQYADLGLLLARTDPSVPKHRGITAFVLDMRSPGVDVRPLKKMDGRSDFSEVFLDDVIVPDTHVIGGEGNGWKVAMSTLNAERVTGAAVSTDYGDGIEGLLEHAAQRLPAFDEDERVGLLTEVGRCVVEHLAVESTAQRRFNELRLGTIPGPEAAMDKLTEAQFLTRMTALGVRLLGEDRLFFDGAPDVHRWQQLLAFMPSVTIAGGTPEIHRNLLGERVLGLPREPRPEAAS
jgi:alkylation response protein AidB-like acyl-CoA dehydrogenase